MSSNDNSLLDFLKKKSLFSYSPSKQSKRSRSKSQQSRHFAEKSHHEAYRKELVALNSKITNIEISEDPYSPNRRNRHTVNYASPPPSYLPQTRTINNDPVLISSPNRHNEGALRADRSENRLWAGLVSYGSNFESARVESAHCLQTLSLKIEGEIESIRRRMEVFNARMFRLLSGEFKAIQERIYRVVEASFKESEKWIREYMKQKEHLLTGQLARSKASLEKELLNIEAMKGELRTPQWRKVAGDMLSTEFEKKIDEVITHSSTVRAGDWNLENFAEDHLQSIEDQIRLIFRLQS